jgi:hypothetical protein
MQQPTNTTTANTNAPATDANIMTNSVELSSPSLLAGDGDGGGERSLSGDGGASGDGDGMGDEGGAAGDAAATVDVSESTGTPSVVPALAGSGKVWATRAPSACASASLPETVDSFMPTIVDPAESSISIAFTEMATASANRCRKGMGLNSWMG